MNMNRPKYSLRKDEMLNCFAKVNSMAEHIEAMEQYCDHIEKALNKACELIAEAVNQDCTIFDEVLESPYLYRTEVREWKEWLLND